MSLHSGIDTVGYISGGCFTKTYGASAPANIANLYASRGLFEDAPNITVRIVSIIMSMLDQFNGGTMI
jgi:hypothetical protein